VKSLARRKNNKKTALKRLQGVASKSLIVRILIRPFKTILQLLLLIMLIPFIITPFYIVFNPPSTLIVMRHIQGQDMTQNWVDLDAIPDRVALGIMASEDARFCSHHGVDWNAMEQQLHDALSGKTPRGASTITMQVTKNLFLWPARSYFRKAYEIPLSLWVDFVLPKRRILEIYLNIAEWGDGVFGIGAAGHYYFRRKPDQLSKGQIALLATALPNPFQRNSARPSRKHRQLARTNLARTAQMGAYRDCL
jgi:monofunctional biosynthetic peptidoglycan transglycosylase